ncbi:hypothetical protein QBC44DRAFT_392624 [Cladorrhinum sp. PSN332]|nr:hypothetical protein QBC44DRAFT_392624 [Cladorrhinum sp. PSN332]
MLSLLSLALLLIGGGLAQTSRCQWANLRSLADLYTESQSSGDVSDLPLLPGFTYVQNSKSITINESLLTTKLRIAHSHSLIDQDGCSTFTKLLVTSSSAPYIIGAQVFYAQPRSGGPLGIKHVSSAVSALSPTSNVTSLLNYTQKENWSSLPRDSQDSHQTLKRVLDAWLDGETVAWDDASGCKGLLGGYYVEGAGACAREVGGDEVVGRSYVVDESVGGVSVIGSVGSNATGVWGGRVVKGKLTYVHEVIASV